MGKITIRRGDTAIINVVYTANGLPVNLTGAKVFFTVRLDFAGIQLNDSDATITADVTVHTEPLVGKTTITLSPVQTNVTAGKYKYDVQVVESGGKVTTIDIGDFQVLPHVTVRTV